MRNRHRLSPFIGVIAALGLAGCVEDGVVLPSNFNSQKSAGLFTINASASVAEPEGVVRALNGIQGAPLAVVDGDESLTYRYWGRPVGACVSCGACNSTVECPTGEVCDGGICRPPDGAHVGLVRLGADTDCGISLESIFPDADADPTAPASYNFAGLVAHMAAVDETVTADIMWQAAFNPGGTCETDGAGQQLGDPIEAGDVTAWTEIALNTLKHLRTPLQGDAFGLNPHNFPISHVEFMGDPIGRLGLTADSAQLDTLFDAYVSFSNAVDQWFNAANNSDRVKIGGISFEIQSVDELNSSGSTKHPILRFIDHCATQGAPLHFLSFATKTSYPYDVRRIASRLRQYLDTETSSSAMLDTALVITDARIDWDASPVRGSGVADDPDRASAYTAAFHAAARIYLQDVPVSWLIAGRGPRVRADLTAGPDDGSTPIIDSAFFDADGTARPAFMGFFPFRQVAGHTRVTIAGGGDTQGLTLMATHPKSSDDVLHVIIANANVQCPVADTDCTNAWVTYDLSIEGMVPSSIPEVGYRFAALDHTSFGVESFHFSDTGEIETLEGSGTVHFTHQMAVPSVHYIQFHRIP